VSALRRAGVVSFEPPAVPFHVSRATTAPWVSRFFEADDRVRQRVTDNRLLPLTPRARPARRRPRHVARGLSCTTPPPRWSGIGTSLDAARQTDAMTLPAGS
jgi:hypothetical protein